MTSSTTTTKSYLDASLFSGDHPEFLRKIAGGKVETRSGVSKVDWAYDIPGGAIDLTTHIQGIGKYKDYVYLAHSVTENHSSLLLWEGGGDHGVLNLDQLEHPCNIQVLDRYMAVSFEEAMPDTAQWLINEAAERLHLPPVYVRANNSKAMIYDLESDPREPRLVSVIPKEGTNCSSIGLAFHPKLDRYVLIMSVADGIEVYLSATNDEPSKWEQHGQFKCEFFGAGAGHNLIPVSDGSIWGIYFDRDDRGQFVLVYKLFDEHGNLLEINKLHRLKVLDIGPFKQLNGPEPDMRWAAGLAINGPHDFEILISSKHAPAKIASIVCSSSTTVDQKTLDALMTVIGPAATQPTGDKTTAKITLYADGNFEGQTREYSASGDLGAQGFSDKVTSLVVESGTWTLFEHGNEGGRSVTVCPYGGPNNDGRYPGDLWLGGLGDKFTSIRLNSER